MPEHHETIERMIERILADPDFRAQYLRDPAAAAESAGFAELAADLALPERRALETLELRGAPPVRA